MKLIRKYIVRGVEASEIFPIELSQSFLVWKITLDGTEEFKPDTLFINVPTLSYKQPLVGDIWTIEIQGLIQG